MDRAIENKAKKRRKYYWIGGSVLVLGLLTWQIFFADHSSKLNVDSDRITIVDVVEQDFLDYMNANGTVEPISTIYLDAVEGGRIEEILIEEGNMVVEGDVILVLSNPDLNLRILTNQANLAEQENRLRDTKLLMEQQRIDLRQQIIKLEYDLLKLDRDYKSNSGLYKKGLIAEQEYLLSKENYELANQTINLFKEKSDQDSVFRETQVSNLENALDRMRENLGLVKEKLESLKVKAPVTGQLGALNAEIGQTIAMGFRLGQVNVLDDFKIAALVDQHWIDRIRKKLAGTHERNNKIYNLEITKVYPEVRSGQFQVDLVFTGEKPENIRAGQTYRINIELGQPETKIQVSIGGFFATTGGQWIYVVDPSGQFAEKRSIRTGRSNPRYYEILEGLEPGEKVINSSYSTFGDNDKLMLK